MQFLFVIAVGAVIIIFGWFLVKRIDIFLLNKDDIIENMDYNSRESGEYSEENEKWKE